MRDYLRGRFGDGVDTTVTVRWIAEDWKTLDRMILEDDSIADKEPIRELIAEEKDPDLRERKIRERFPEQYAYIRHKYYPRLRCVDFRYDLRRRDMIKDTIHTTEPDTLYARGVRLLRERRYAEAVSLLYSYRDRNSLIALLSLGYDRSAHEIARRGRERLSACHRRDAGRTPGRSGGALRKGGRGGTEAEVPRKTRSRTD